MASTAESKADQFQWRVRPGLLLFFLIVLTLAVGVITGLAWRVPLLERGRSRIGFVVAGTLMLFLWGATKGY
jgi:hypothetical protein